MIFTLQRSYCDHSSLNWKKLIVVSPKRSVRVLYGLKEEIKGLSHLLGFCVGSTETGVGVAGDGRMNHVITKGIISWECLNGRSG